MRNLSKQKISEMISQAANKNAEARENFFRYIKLFNLGHSGEVALIRCHDKEMIEAYLQEYDSFFAEEEELFMEIGELEQISVYGDNALKNYADILLKRGEGFAKLVVEKQIPLSFDEEKILVQSGICEHLKMYTRKCTLYVSNQVLIAEMQNQEVIEICRKNGSFGKEAKARFKELAKK